MKLLIVLSILILTGCASNGRYTADSKVCSKNYDCLDQRPLVGNWKELYEQKDETTLRSTNFANQFAIYSVYSADVYDKPPSKYERIPLPSNETNVQILEDSGEEPSIGFRAKAWLRYKDKSSLNPELVVAYRGTKFTELADWIRGNFVFFKLGYRTQFDAAKEFFERAKSHVAEKGITVDKTILTGHSLGGGLAEYVQRFNPESRAIVFDTSPNTGWLYSLFDSTEPKNVVRIHEKGEVLQFFRIISSPDFEFDTSPDEPYGDDIRTIWYNFYDSNPISAHDIRDFSMMLLQVAKISGNQSAITILDEVSNEVGTNTPCKGD